MTESSVSPLPSSIASEASSRRWIHWPRSRGRRVLFFACYLLFWCGLLWGANKLYWNWKAGVPLNRTAEVWDRYYPTLRRSGALTADVRRDDHYIDVLMLGGSTIESGWSDAEIQLEAGLQREFGDRVRVYNLATIAHTSRDSALKFSRLSDRPWDLVLIYDGFNDCRMNNCLPGRFREDYGHCVWYDGLERRLQAATPNLPAELVHLGGGIGLGIPEINLEQYGGDIKTTGPLRRNLEEIRSSAIRNDSLVLLQTFAWHIPEDYSDEALELGKLGYGTRTGSSLRCPLHMWGRAEHVVKCIQAHNAVIRDMAREKPKNTIFVDQDRLMSGNGKNFVDVCHWSDEGCRVFIANLLPTVIERLRPRVGQN